MQPVKIPEKLLTLAENQDEYLDLDIVVMTDDNDNPFMCSRWLPSAEELEALNAGCPVQLAVQGQSHPPVMVGVYADPDILGDGTPSPVEEQPDDGIVGE